MSTVAFDQSRDHPVSEASPLAEVPASFSERAFIPVSRTDVIHALLGPEFWATQGQQSQVADVLNKIGLLRQHKSGVMLNKLSDIYDPFNPDDETVNLTEASEMERLEKRRVFNSKLKELVTSANYKELRKRISREALQDSHRKIVLPGGYSLPQDSHTIARSCILIIGPGGIYWAEGAAAGGG